MIRLFLIGMPGAGKTTWGKKAAEALGLDFTDLDEQIVYRFRATIPELFERYGEEGFREREHEVLKRLIANTTSGILIACGGGTPCFYDNLAIMKQSGIVVYLAAATDTILKNLSADTGRPLLQGHDAGSLRTHIEELQREREPWYLQAHQTIQAEALENTTFEEIFRSCIKGH